MRYYNSKNPAFKNWIFPRHAAFTNFHIQQKRVDMNEIDFCALFGPSWAIETFFEKSDLAIFLYFMMPVDRQMNEPTNEQNQTHRKLMFKAGGKMLCMWGWRHLHQIQNFACVPFASFIIPNETRLYVGFELWKQIDQADFIAWMSFLPSKLVEEISPNPEALSANI